MLTEASPTDLWILSRLSGLVSECNGHFENLELFHATKALHTFWVSDFCDVYLVRNLASVNTRARAYEHTHAHTMKAPIRCAQGSWGTLCTTNMGGKLWS